MGYEFTQSRVAEKHFFLGPGIEAQAVEQNQRRIALIIYSVLGNSLVATRPGILNVPAGNLAKGMAAGSFALPANTRSLYGALAQSQWYIANQTGSVDTIVVIEVLQEP